MSGDATLSVSDEEFQSHPVRKLSFPELGPLFSMNAINLVSFCSLPVFRRLFPSFHQLKFFFLSLDPLSKRGFRVVFIKITISWRFQQPRDVHNRIKTSQFRMRIRLLRCSLCDCFKLIFLLCPSLDSLLTTRVTVLPIHRILRITLFLSPSLTTGYAYMIFINICSVSMF